MMERPFDILLVEDNAADIGLTDEALREASTPYTLHVARDGEDALAFLRRQGTHAGQPRPDLILLDLNMPRKGGREVLAEIKEDSDLRRIPVVVLTTSSDLDDIRAAYNLHANCYLVKPVDLSQFFNAIAALKGFWLSVVTLPSE
ncbi:MAG TPA: response regulator [Chloroflexota bacterium]|nr:response regulator [Chloroflexota bacterium]